MIVKDVIKYIVVNSDFLSGIRRRVAINNENIAHKKREKAYKATNNPQKIRNLKGTMTGRRCFIIGNGPSLKVEDLELLKDEITFAANRIWLMYDKTEWRPTYYMCQDWNMILSEHERIATYPETVFVGFDGMYEHNIKIDNAIGYLCDKRPYVGRKVPFPFSFNCDECVIDGSIVTYSAIQLALYMGFEKIYLLGVDNNYQYTVDKNKKITKHEEVKNTHFDDRYKELSLKTKNNIFGIGDPEMSNNAYVAAREAAQKKGIKIYNATRGGKLEVFERVVLENALIR